MATTISELIRLSLERLKKEHLNLTPDNYSKIFCQVAKEKKVVVEDCQKVTKTLARLDKSLQDEAKRFKVSDVDELLKYFTAVINRSNTIECQKINQAFLVFCKRLLQVISSLHNKKASELAAQSLEKLDVNYQTKTIEYLKDAWFEFLSSYDDSFYERLNSYVKVNKDDLKKSMDNIYKFLNEGDNDSAYGELASLVIASLTPSIASSINDELATLSYELNAKPDMLASPAVQEDIKKLIKKRVELDKKEVAKRVSALNALLDEINKKVINLLDTSELHTKEVISIKSDLKSMDINKGSFETVQARLLKIADSLEAESKGLSEQMKTDRKTIEALKLKVNKLEGALVEAKKESKEDFLTHTANKRALNDELESAEEAYKRYRINYSICFFDLDRFKVINDTYGHEAGDVILATLGKILNKYARKVDVIGRYGGEEFLVILPSTNEEQAVNFGNKICNIIENFKFIYKKERINVTISGGVAERAKLSSKDEVVQLADSRLYEAKENGRNQISPII